MEQHAGIDVSLKLSSVCMVDTSGKIVRETKVASEPEASHSLKGRAPGYRSTEPGPLSRWLHVGLVRRGLRLFF